MSDVVNSIFGRTPSEYAASTSTPETRATETIVDDRADLADSATTSAPTAIVVVEPAAAESGSAADTETDTDAEATADDTDTAETDTAEDVDTDERVEDEDEAEEADEASAPEDLTAEAETEEEEETVVAPARPAAAVRGNTSVDDGVVTKVVTMVARKAEGVHELGESISVGIEDDVALIEIPLVIEFGHAVKALAEQLRTEVIEAVEQFLGLEVEAVDVRVTDIHLPDAG